MYGNGELYRTIQNEESAMTKILNYRSRTANEKTRMAFCTKCDQLLLFDSFYKQKNNDPPITYHCKDCIKVNVKKWYRENSEKSKAYVKEWSKKNPDKMKAYLRKSQKKRSLSNPNYQREYLKKRKRDSALLLYFLLTEK